MRRELQLDALPAVIDGHASIPLTVRYSPSTEPNFNSNAWLSITSGGPPPDSVVLALRAKTLDPVATLTVLDGTAPVDSGATVYLGMQDPRSFPSRALSL